MQKFILKFLGIGFACILAAACRPAQAAESKTAARKLVNASWHCWGSYPCDLWHLTRPARPGESAEKIVLMGEHGTSSVFDESASAPKTKERVAMTIPKSLKLTGVGWKCYGGGQCEAYLQLRTRRAGEAAESYTFENGSEHYRIEETP